MILWFNSVQFIAMNKFKKNDLSTSKNLHLSSPLKIRYTVLLRKIKHLIIYNNYSISNLNSPCLDHALYNDKLTMINVMEK